ncbi:UspA domain-containing protein [Natrinema pellirubrum DSM 15624]|uniref:Universal stress protein UspA-like protein n=2 Tax=Natrinema TaxID=88723 RepID=L0JP16_NATP1|nr:MULTISPECIES: universal stress protein [Natrinema]ELZ11856.1 UspA domain-containing protein [Natrinema thermotolerans DSM 11552]AGB33275.1 universal stress protein UspA-like protein [Natrinema pellirubrum DSM 15624]ELY71642.1 UspA domain-containing protein [Natrinema pellirubrum DSM 15624]QCC58510.1 universal stress protein [Natrinema thermotolerans]WMT09645.1 universal stress protein [Natrinema thermotolerans]
MYETILLPTDGSDHAATVAAHAIDVAATRDATLHVLSVVDDRAFLVLDDNRVEQVRDDLEATAREAVDEAATRAADRGVETTTAVDTGNPAECIVDYAASEPVDLIVMGTSGDEYERNVVGSVSQRVVREAPVPVTTVGPDV